MNSNRVFFSQDMAYMCEHIYIQANIYANLAPLDDIQSKERRYLHVTSIVLSRLTYLLFVMDLFIH